MSKSVRPTDRCLIDPSLLGAIEGVLSNLTDHPEYPGSDISGQLAQAARRSLRGTTVGDTHALAQACLTTLDAIASRSTINDRGDFIISATDAELADETTGIQVIAELNSLRAYLSQVVAGSAKDHPLGAMVRAYRRAIDLVGSLRESMANLGFYEPDDTDPQVEGSEAVDMLNQLASRITQVVNDSVRVAPPAPVAEPATLAALAGVIDQLRALGVPDWHGAEGLSLESAERVLRNAGYTVGEQGVTAPPADHGIDLSTLEIERGLVLSSDHIPYDLYTLLKRDAESASGTAYRDFIATTASPYAVRLDIRGNADGDGLATPAASLDALITFARSQGLTHLTFDRDGMVIQSLPRIGHGVPETCLGAHPSTPAMGG